MAEKKITRKVISRVSKKEPEVEQVKEPEEQKNTRSKKQCLFCLSKTSPSYTDIVTLRRFLTDRGRIVPKLKSSVCSKHQRAVTKNIKYARHLSLLQFTPKV